MTLNGNQHEHFILLCLTPPLMHTSSNAKGAGMGGWLGSFERVLVGPSCGGGSGPSWPGPPGSWLAAPMRFPETMMRSLTTSSTLARRSLRWRFPILAGAKSSGRS